MLEERTVGVCYICSRPIRASDWSREHIVPKNLFLPADRVDLITLPAHRACNASYSKDDEYFRLCMTVLAAPHSRQARALWEGAVLRGFGRRESQGFRSIVLRGLTEIEERTDAGIFTGRKLPAMFQDAQRIHRVVNRIGRGIYAYRTGNVLPADWPVSSDWIKPAAAAEFRSLWRIRLFRLGNETVLYDSKHLDTDHSQSLVYLVFYRCIEFAVYLGEQLRFQAEVVDTEEAAGRQ